MFFIFRPKPFQPAVVDQLLKSLLSKPPSSKESKRRRRNTDFIDGESEEEEEAEDDPAAEMLADAQKSPARSSEDVEDPETWSSSVKSFNENFSMPTFYE